MADPLYEDDSDAEVAAKAAQTSSRKGGVSDSMRAKLLKENQALGGDPDAPSINFGDVLALSYLHAHHQSFKVPVVYRGANFPMMDDRGVAYCRELNTIRR